MTHLALCRHVLALAQIGILASAESFPAAPDVAFIETDPRRFSGPDGEHERISTAQPGAKLTWTASFANVSAAGTLGYNDGRKASPRPNPDGN